MPSREAPLDSRALAHVLGEFDVIVAQKLPVSTQRRLTARRLVYDLYTPALPEVLAAATRAGRSPNIIARLDILGQQYALATADAFVCAAERHRDYWLGGLGDLGRLDGPVAAGDRSGRGLIDVVPFGVPDEEPAGAPALRGAIPGIGPDDQVALWSGGLVNWTDPVTIIRAVAKLAETNPRLRLVFLGVPRDGEPEPAASRAARDESSLLGLTNRFVFFLETVPYAERAGYLLDADVGVAAFLDSFEHRLANRARLVDFIWASLPIVTTQGDVVGDLVDTRGLGYTVPAGDVAGWTIALADALNEGRTGRFRTALSAVGDELRWSRVVHPLVKLIHSHTAPPPSGAARVLEMQAFALRVRASAELRVHRVRAVR
jgi:glycosyltransferase involved in cell wall biosynthesis